MGKISSDRIFNATNIIMTMLITIVMVYPLYFIIIASISEPYAVAMGKVTIWPAGFTLDAYKNVFKNDDVWTGYRNSLVYMFAGTLYNLMLTLPAAYVLTKKYLPMRSMLAWFFFITMYFSGGLIPTYILMRNLGFVNTPYALIIGSGVSCYNLIVSRQFFANTIPEELYESARIDGANEFVGFFHIAMPLAKSIIAVMALFYGIGHWNSYYGALVYIHKSEYYPLQLVLRNILIQNETAFANIELSGAADGDTLQEAARLVYMANAMKYALIFIASAPLLAAYPFVQKYFVKGVMIGSVKG